MSYLLDKKIKRRKILNLSLLIIFLLFGIYFRNPIFNKLSAFSHFVFRPVVYLGNSIGGDFSKIGVYFSSKSSLLKDKQNLTDTLNEKTSTYSNYSSLLEENTELKEILGRKNIKTNMVLASILSKPNTSLYDTLIIDAGFEDDISLGSRVFAYGNVPIGKVA
jgi:cell shape-determining protein MreC